MLFERDRERERERERMRGRIKAKRETKSDAHLFDLYSILNLVRDPGAIKRKERLCYTPSCGKTNYFSVPKKECMRETLSLLLLRFE